MDAMMMEPQQELAAKAINNRGYLVVAMPPHLPALRSGDVMRNVGVSQDGECPESPLGAPCSVACETDAADFIKQAVLMWGGEESEPLPCWNGYRYYRVITD